MAKSKKAIEKLEDIQQKGERLEVLINLSKKLRDKERRVAVPFNDFLYTTSSRPENVFRDIFQLFYDMLHYYVPEGEDEYEITSESIGFVHYDASRLFAEDCANPFFADRLFANRIMNLGKNLLQRSEVNYIYLFEGPPGSGKSTFLNNLLKKFEAYTYTPEGTTFETLWRINSAKLSSYKQLVERINDLTKNAASADNLLADQIYSSAHNRLLTQRDIDIACPNHDHPILQIPKSYRKQFLEELIPDEEFKHKLFNTKAYEWVLRDSACIICKSIYDALMDDLGDPLEVFSMLYARKVLFNRQMGEGISVFNPGDQLIKEPIYNQNFQTLINDMFQTDTIKYIYSSLAKTNDGVYAIMDIKENNIQRLKSLHGVISDKVHKVEFVEEHIKSLFLGLINPEDKVHYQGIKSFEDRIITVKIPYILDYRTEVEIYRNKFGDTIDHVFLPGVLENFAKTIISTRLDSETSAIKKWIKEPEKYSNYVDSNLFLLKMEIYSGNIPDWLVDEDIKMFTKDIRKSILVESEVEGQQGISGRMSINVFNNFYNKYTREGKLITMEDVKSFFIKNSTKVPQSIPEGFLDSLEQLYNYHVVQAIKEAIYDYNEQQISRDILNYLFAINFEANTSVVCPYTGEKIEVEEAYFESFERLILGSMAEREHLIRFRDDQQKTYVTKTVSQEMKLNGKEIQETDQFKNLFDRVIKNLKENAMAPLVKNDNFRRAIQDFGTSGFNTHDNRMKKDVNFLIQNLKSKFNYTESGARQISLYALDRGLL